MLKTSKAAKQTKEAPSLAKREPSDVARIDLANLLSRTARNTYFRPDEIEECRIAREQLEAAQTRYNRALAKLATVLIDNLSA